MIAIQLSTGKTVFKTFQEWIEMTPEQYQDMIANNEGIEIDYPFDHVLDRVKEDVTYWDIPELPEAIIEEIINDELTLDKDGEDISQNKKRNKK